MTAKENMAMDYIVEKARIKGEYAELDVRSPAGDVQTILMDLEDFLMKVYRKGDTISASRFSALKNESSSIDAYRHCLQRLAVKDRTGYEIKKWLRENTTCSEESIQSIFQKLTDRGYIDDKRYADEIVSKMRRSLLGLNRIRHELEKRGIASDIIKQKINECSDEEQKVAYRFSEREMTDIRDESVKMRKNRIRLKMIQKGYSSELAEESIARLDFTGQDDTEMESLRLCVQKAKKHYEKKYTGYKLKSSVYRYCASHGYANENIEKIFNEMEWENDKGK